MIRQNFFVADRGTQPLPRRRHPFAIGFSGIRSPLKFSSALPVCSRGCRQKFPSPLMEAHANGHPAEFQSCNVPHPARRAAQTPGRSRRKRRHSFPPRIISLFPSISCLFCACMKAPVGTSDRRFLWLSGLKRVLHVFKSSASCRGSVRSGDSCAGRRFRPHPCV